jgi:NAD(P)-dependent dehydrogenase (short-subunit alcohol dehydrogenase family)
VVASLAGFYDRFRKQELKPRFKETDNFNGKTVLITGANSGLGFALSVQAAERGARVIMACRRQIPEAGEKVKKLSGSDKIEMRHLDLSKINSIHNFADNLVRDKIQLDVVILNAASAASRSRPTDSGQDELFLVNYFSNFILANLLLSKEIIKPNPKNQPRLIFISSDSHRGASAIDYNEFGHYFDYGVSKAISNYSYFKLVLNTFATELSRRVNNGQTVVQINCICPGPVNTNIIREVPFPIRIILRGIFSVIFRSPAKAAPPVIYLATSDDFIGKTNQYLHMFIPKRMDEKVYDEKEGKKLWEESEKLWKLLDEKAEIYQNQDLE